MPEAVLEFFHTSTDSGTDANVLLDCLVPKNNTIW